jgi:hypothetical protein
MAEIFHIGHKKASRRIKKLLKLRWLEEVKFEDDVGYKMSPEGRVAFVKMIHLTFIINLEESESFGKEFPPPDGLEKYADYIVKELGHPITAFTYMEPIISEFGITTLADLDYYIQIASRKD